MEMDLPTVSSTPWIFLPSTSQTVFYDDFNDSISSRQNGTEPDWGQLGPEAYLVPIFFAIIMVVGLVGNYLVIYIIVKNKEMHTVTNYFILNLAVTDLSFLVFVVPFTASTYPLTSWVFGQFMCKFVIYYSQITVTATCITLTAMSVDRYFAIVHPIKSKQWRTPRMAKVVSACLWLGSIVGSLPMAIFSRLEPYDYYGPQEEYCSMFYPSNTWEAGYMTYTFVAAYILPVVIITVCYSQMLRRLWTRIAPDSGLTETDRVMPRRFNQTAMQQRRRTTRIVLVVVVCFTVCWGPIMILNLVKSYHPGFPLNFHMACVKIWAHCMSYANSSVNPFVYAFMGENFRKAFRKSFPRCFRRARVAPQVEEPYSNSDHLSLLSRRQGAAQRQTLPLQPINEGGQSSLGTISPSM
ncbi:G-protein coupled receptor 54-like [Branchiostoma lanceolatum]|uniref:G-protein coupled receptor 54-like n=1 Tax=Branchiostoma lanceolatum TaxID=7740 RepID=UPI0034513468